MKLLGGAAFLVLACNAAFGGNLLLNPSFESPTLNDTSDTYATGSTAITDWIVTGTSCMNNCVAQLRNDYTEPNDIGTISFEPEDGNYSLDLTGSGNTLDGGIEQTVSDAAGALYSLSFWVGNMDDNASRYALPSTVSVLLNGSALGTFSNDNNTSHQLKWEQFSVSFTGTGSDTVQFQNATPSGDDELGLDNVNLDLAAAAPEPGSAWLIGAGLLAFGVFGRKRGSRRVY